MVEQPTFDEWENSNHPINQMYFDKTLSIRIHQNLFGKLAGVDPTGAIVPHVDSINIGTFEKMGAWAPVELSMEYFGDFRDTGAYKARYWMVIHFNNPDSHRFEVAQEVDFVAIPVDGIWQLLGVKGYYNHDLVSTATVILDGVLAMYR